VLGTILFILVTIICARFVIQIFNCFVLLNDPLCNWRAVTESGLDEANRLSSMILCGGGRLRLSEIALTGREGHP
jgi:hypothetical protein